MGVVKKSVFISYRREGGEGFAQMFSEKLAKKRYHVFYDIESIGVGLFDERILQEIEQIDVFLLILTKGALDRCVNEGDWVRVEIAYALKLGKPIIPLFFRDFEFPKDLPADIAAVALYNGIDIRDMNFFETKFKQLCSMINDAAKAARTSVASKKPSQPAAPVLAPMADEKVLLTQKSPEQTQFLLALQRAKNGDTESQLKIARHYQNGICVKQNDKQAFKWYKKAAKSDNENAILLLAQCYENGIGVKKSAATADALYAKLTNEAHNNIKKQAEEGRARLHKEVIKQRYKNRQRKDLLKVLTALIPILLAIMTVVCLFLDTRGFVIAAVISSLLAILAAIYWGSRVESGSFRKLFIAALILSTLCCLVGGYQWIFVHGTSDFLIKDGTLKKSYANTQTVEVPENVTVIREYAFGFFNSPRKCEFQCVILPDSVTHIERGAFTECHMLRDIHLGPNIVFIGKSVFYGCSNLTIHFHGTQEQWGEIEKEGWDIGLTNYNIVFE